MGILFTLLALFSWGIGDFLIQRSARQFGDWVALFFITAFGSIVLFPFVYKDLGPLLLNQHAFLILLAAGMIMTLAAYFNFEALRVGKISVIEPIFAFEIAIVGILSAAFFHEYLTPVQLVLVLAVMVGIFLVSARSLHHFKNITWEKGLILAILGTVAMGVTDFMYTDGGRLTNPLLVNWFTSLVIAIISLAFLWMEGRTKDIIKDLKSNPRLAVSVSFLDNLAWVAYIYAALYVPLAIVTSISESYIVLAALLGMKFNKEKLKLHQQLGFILTITAAILLALLTVD